MRETLGVAAAMAFVVFAMAVTMGGETTTPGAAGSPAVLVSADQVAFRDLEPADQRLYRQLLEGLGAAEAVRLHTRAWPTVAELAARGIPPFATDPLDRGRYTWRLLHDGIVYNYVGTPAPGAHRKTLVIVLVEPDPAVPPDPQAVNDETHHILADRTVLHVTIWTGSRTLDTPMIDPAYQDGWKRITMLNP